MSQKGGVALKASEEAQEGTAVWIEPQILICRTYQLTPLDEELLTWPQLSITGSKKDSRVMP